MIGFPCPHCYLRLQAADDKAGKRLRCKCGKPVAVPFRTVPKTILETPDERRPVPKTMLVTEGFPGDETPFEPIPTAIIVPDVQPVAAALATAWYQAVQAPIPPPDEQIHELPDTAILPPVRQRSRHQLEACPDCGHLVSAVAASCTQCGCPFDKPEKRRRVEPGVDVAGMVAIGSLILAVVLCAIGLGAPIMMAGGFAWGAIAASAVAFIAGVAACSSRSSSPMGITSVLLSVVIGFAAVVMQDAARQHMSEIFRR